MIEFTELTEEKKKEYIDILYAMVNHDNDDNSLVFLFKNNNQEKILQLSNDLCRVWYYLDKNSIAYNEFGIDDNYELTSVAFDDAILYEGDEESYFYNLNTHCFEDFAFIPKNEKDFQGYDGIACYSQYNEETDIRVDLLYQHMQKPNNTIYKLHLKNPIQVSIMKNKSKNKKKYDEIYARYDFDARDNYQAFKIATIKDYGLLNTFNKDLVSLQKSSKISRYYKVLSINSNNELKVSFPFGSQYKLEEIYTYIKKLGFNTEVPDYVIDMNNQKSEEYLESLVLAANLKALNNAYIKKTGKSLRLIKEL